MDPRIFIKLSLHSFFNICVHSWHESWFVLSLFPTLSDDGTSCHKKDFEDCNDGTNLSNDVDFSCSSPRKGFSCRNLVSLHGWKHQDVSLLVIGTATPTPTTFNIIQSEEHLHMHENFGRNKTTSLSIMSIYGSRFLPNMSPPINLSHCFPLSNPIKYCHNAKCFLFLIYLVLVLVYSSRDNQISLHI